MNGEFVAAMEDVLDLYAEPYDPGRPVVCFDETSTQLLGDVREPLPAQPARPRRQDYEYRRGGNLFLFCEPLADWRHIAITQRRTMADFALQMRWLTDVANPDATVIPLGPGQPEHPPHGLAVRDLPCGRSPTHRETSRVSPHPKHAGCLNMAEIELSVLSRACLKGRNPDADALQRAITAYETRRNAARIPIYWRFGTEDARTKLQRFYPCFSNVG